MNEQKLYVIDWRALQLSFQLSYLLQGLYDDYSEQQKPIPDYLREMLRIVDSAISEAHEALCRNEWIIDSYPDNIKIKVPGMNKWEKEVGED